MDNYVIAPFIDDHLIIWKNNKVIFNNATSDSKLERNFESVTLDVFIKNATKKEMKIIKKLIPEEYLI